MKMFLVLVTIFAVSVTYAQAPYSGPSSATLTLQIAVTNKQIASIQATQTAQAAQLAAQVAQQALQLNTLNLQLTAQNTQLAAAQAAGQ